MKLFTLLMSLAILFLSLPSCGRYCCDNDMTYGSGEIITKELTFDEFDKITLLGSGNVYLTQGDEHKVTIETDDNILPLIDVYRAGGEIFLKPKDNESISPTVLNYHITLKNFNKGTIEGSGNFKGMTEFHQKSLNLLILGSGNFNLTGSIDNCYTRIDGSGNIQLQELETINSEALINGSGNIYVWASDRLKATINGSGNIYYRGDPDDLDVRISGSGDVIKLGD